MPIRQAILAAAVVGWFTMLSGGPSWADEPLTAAAQPVSYGSIEADGTWAKLYLDLPTSSRSPFVLPVPRSTPPFPIILNEAVQRSINSFLDHSDTFEATLRRGRPYIPEMVRELRAQGVPDDMVYLAFAESAFSRRGRGWWQFNAATAKTYGLHVNSWVDERRDPILSTRAAAEYLADLHDAAGHDWPVAVIGWNGGDIAINRYWQLRGNNNFYRLMHVLPSYTRQLLARFMAVDFIARNANAYGIAEIDFDQKPAYRVVNAKSGTTLSSLAASYHTTVSRLRELNPALLKDRVPQYSRIYTVRVPAQSRRLM